MIRLPKLPPVTSIDARIAEFRIELQEILEAPTDPQKRRRLIEISDGLLKSYDEKSEAELLMGV